MKIMRVLTVLSSFGLDAATISGCGSASHEAADAGKPGASTSAAASGTTSGATPASAATSASPSPSAGFAQLESKYRAQLGLYALDTGTGRSVTFQPDQRFAFCSTVKALAAGELLRRDTDAQLAQTITYQASDLVDYSPVTSQHVKDGMSLTSVVTAAIEVSDNTALNLMLNQLGGPSALQTALRDLDDTTTNTTRDEPTLNSAVPGDVRDTSTARAMAADLRAYVLGDTLTPQHRTLLTSWLLANTTGATYIRAGVPAGWTVADKTGSGDYGARNDIAVLWPRHGAPIVLAVLTDRSGGKDAASADALIADATKLAIQQLG